ncbi:sensor histidine kinase [Paractinoplanes atraurantiacus]|uniref:histidine kinase n=1 Tax=Paractinoplanes atraurantiacus TaxID=1036182 RepID=A0A285J125_9ACTN|nr:sensor histidine kinase [Actinoplanes atraurantiacus]SNY53597.1 Histidine kinase [Actinoplanes atraurantiacus]
MSRYSPRHLLTDATLALALILLTLGPGLVKGWVTPTKPGDPSTYLDRSGLPAGEPWWIFAALIVGGVLIRQRWPFTGLVLAAAGTVGHLALQTKFQLLDLALPLMLYTVATVARRRRHSVAVLALAMLMTYAAMLGGRFHVDQETAVWSGKEVEQQQLKQEAAGGEPVATVMRKTLDPPSVFAPDRLLDAGQAVMEMWLLLIAAFAIGDAMRSRRAHLAAVEQRTADLAREERQRAALAVAAERTRITRELHDVVAHGMSVMVVQAQGAAAALDRHPDRAATALQHVIEVGRSSLAEMRRLIAAGRTDPAEDPQLAPLAGVGAVPALVDELRSTGMRVELHVDGVPTAMPAAVDVSAYRIVQEALTNTLRHAGPGAGATVLLEFHPERLRVVVADDGTGPAEGADDGGNGLRGIAERIAMLGGTLDAGSAGGAGFRVCATLPLRAGESLVPR